MTLAYIWKAALACAFLGALLARVFPTGLGSSRDPFLIALGIVLLASMLSLDILIERYSAWRAAKRMQSPS